MTLGELLVWLIPAAIAGALIWGTLYEFRSGAKDQEDE